MQRRRTGAAITAVAALVALLGPNNGATATPGPAFPLTVTATGTVAPGWTGIAGQDCPDGGLGDAERLHLDGDVPPGALSTGGNGSNSSTATLRATLAIHDSPDANGPAEPFLDPATSHATIATHRGTLRFRLDGGGCEARNLVAAAGAVTGGGTLALAEATGAYAGADAGPGGSWQLTATPGPGADNPWSLALDAALTVPAPALDVTVVDTAWGNLGLDYLVRRPTVTFAVTNVGDGPAFGATLHGVTSPTPGVAALGPTSAHLGDLAPGETAHVAVRFQLGLLEPCALVVLGCGFATTLATTAPDAFDQPLTSSTTVGAHAPDLPGLA